MVFTVMLPCFILDKILGSPVLQSYSMVMWAIGLGFSFILLGALIGLIVGRIIGLERGTGMRTFALTAGCQNFGFTAAPVAEILWGPGILGLLFVHNIGVELAMWSVGVMMMSGDRRISWRRLLNGPIIAVIIGLSLVALDLDSSVTGPFRKAMSLMGAGALFIEDARNPANRISPAFLEAFEKPWKLTAQVPYSCLGPQLSALIERAFVNGLHDPALRPSALEWEDALVQTADLMHPCANSTCPAASFVVHAGQHSCPFCGTQLPAPVLLAHSYFDRGNGAFAASGRVKILHHHAAIHSWHIRPEFAANEHASAAQAQRQAYLVREHSQIWLMNEAIADLRDIGAQTDVAPGQPVALKPGQKLLLSRANPAQLWLIDEIKAA